MGHTLESYRKLRKSHPKLVAEVDIMSQPASNIDTVILTRVIECQAREYAATLGKGTASARSSQSQLRGAWPLPISSTA